MGARNGFCSLLLMGKLGLPKACGTSQPHSFFPFEAVRVILYLAQIQVVYGQAGGYAQLHTSLAQNELSSQTDGCEGGSFKLESLGQLKDFPAARSCSHHRKRGATGAHPSHSVPSPWVSWRCAQPPDCAAANPLRAGHAQALPRFCQPAPAEQTEQGRTKPEDSACPGSARLLPGGTCDALHAALKRSDGRACSGHARLRPAGTSGASHYKSHTQAGRRVTAMRRLLAAKGSHISMLASWNITMCH